MNPAGFAFGSAARLACGIAATLACGLWSAPLFAQEAAYPARRITFMVLAPAAGPNDLLGRVLAERLSKTMGQPVIVENRPGGTAISATEAVARQAPDGYTVLQVPPAHVLSSMMGKVPFDPIASFDAVAHLVSTPFVLAVNPSVSARTLKIGRAHV